MAWVPVAENPMGWMEVVVSFWSCEFGWDHGAYSLARFLQGAPLVGFSKVVLTEEHSFGNPVLESHGSMLPVADMVAEDDVEDGIPLVEAVEEEPESVDYAVLFRHDDEHHRRVAFASDNFSAPELHLGAKKLWIKRLVLVYQFFAFGCFRRTFDRRLWGLVWSDPSSLPSVSSAGFPPARPLHFFIFFVVST
jgi:hypothetical protein